MAQEHAQEWRCRSRWVTWLKGWSNWILDIIWQASKSYPVSSHKSSFWPMEYNPQSNWFHWRVTLWLGSSTDTLRMIKQYRPLRTYRGNGLRTCRLALNSNLDRHPDSEVLAQQMSQDETASLFRGRSEVTVSLMAGWLENHQWPQWFSNQKGHVYDCLCHIRSHYQSVGG